MRQSRFININFVKNRRIRRKLEEHFSPSFYLSQMSEVDRAEIVDPLEHFLIYWSQNGLDPSPFFSMSNYLMANPDVAASGQNPLTHFVTNGILEKRPLEPHEQSSQSLIGQVSSDWEVDDSQVIAREGTQSLLVRYLDKLGIIFDFEPNRIDENFYRSQIPELDITDCNAHYEEIGWKMGLNPTPWFNTLFYLKTYDDVNNAGANPFLHFVNQGFTEFRIPNHLNFRSFFSVLNAQSVEAQSRNWFNPDSGFKLIDLESARKSIVNRKIKDGEFVVSIGHSKYLNDVGGVQLYTFAEAKKFNEIGINYLHISPSRTLPILADSIHRDLCVNLTLNNKEIRGDFMLSDFVELMHSVNSDPFPVAVIVNSLFGWHPELLVDVLDNLEAKSHYWFFHDYSTFCTNPNLSFENVVSCRNPNLGAGICGTCRYGKNRDSHVHRIAKLLNSREWTMVTPSKSATKNVCRYLGINAARILTIPHGHLSAGRQSRLFENRPRIAFVGQPIVQKGWQSYLNFVDLNLKEFDFYHFGSIPTSEFGIRYFPLKNNYKDLNTARDLLIHHRIDAVFICPNWEETFCFVAYEALAAGCKVICNSESGNVIDAVGDNSIVYNPNSPLKTDVLKRLIIEGRNFDSCISEFVYSGTVASEFLK